MKIFDFGKKWLNLSEKSTNAILEVSCLSYGFCKWDYIYTIDINSIQKLKTAIIKNYEDIFVLG